MAKCAILKEVIMPSTPDSEAIDRLAEVLQDLVELAEQLTEDLSHIAKHVHCVCCSKYGLPDPDGED